MNRKRIGYGFLGVKLDAVGLREGESDEQRRARWRPTVSFCKWLELDEIHLIQQSHQARLAEVIERDIHEVCPDTIVHHDEIRLDQPWDLKELYSELLRLVRDHWSGPHGFDVNANEYFVHLRTGHTPAQICMYHLALQRRVPAEIVHTISPTDPVLTKEMRRGIDPTWGRYEVHRAEPLQIEGVRLLGAMATLDPDDVRQLSGAHLRSLKDRAYKALIEDVKRVAARTREPILLTGETGTGKTTLAKDIFAIRRESFAMRGSFVAVNCATLEGNLVNALLFGHERGAFTGAEERRKGLLEEADGGLLFLDEVGELPLDTQARLLKAIEEKRFRRVGGDREVHSDFLVVAATNVDLQERVTSGRFRRDLLHRLDVFSFILPPLRSRPADIEQLMTRALEEQPHCARFHADARAKYFEFASSTQATWSGNFRDVRASAARMAARAENGVITSAVVEHEIRELSQRWAIHSTGTDRLVDRVLGAKAQDHSEAELAKLEGVLRVCLTCATQTEASGKLFAASRAKNKSDLLAKYLQRFGLRFSTLRIA